MYSYRSCCSRAYLPPSEVTSIVEYIRKNTSQSHPCTLIFTETGIGCAELMIALQMSDVGPMYVQRVILMDRILSTSHVDGQTPCQTGMNYMKDLGIPVTVYNSYAALTPELQSLSQVIMMGVHQGNWFRHAEDLREYSTFLQTCIIAASEGRLLTPYLNFMYCQRLGMALVSQRHGLFEWMPVTSCHTSGHMRVNEKQWDAWYSWVTNNIVLPSVATSHSIA